MGEALHKQGLTVLGIRLAGHATNPPDLIRTRWWDWMASVEDGINLLKDSCDHIFYAGLSLGGVLALTTAGSIQPSGVIAMSAPYSLSDDWRLKFARPISLFVPWMKKDLSKRKEGDYHVDYPAYPIRSCAEVNDLIQVMYQRLGQIKAPVMLVNSKSDTTVPLAHGEKIKGMLTATTVEHLILEKSGHVVTEDNEQERELLFERAYQFIQRCGK